jgi:RimJ/RimL family protein N-acetyltransferase
MALSRLFTAHSTLTFVRAFPLYFTGSRCHGRLAKTSHPDVPVILQLIKELAQYEKSLHEVLATTESLRATLSFPASTSETRWTPGYAKAFLIIPSPAEVTDDTGKPAVAGMALYFHNYSTWTSAPGIYLEDLFVRPAFRGKGYGKALLAELAKECLRLDCKRLDWSVLKWNKPSIDFYLSEVVGGKVMEEWQGIRVEGEKLERLARH